MPIGVNVLSASTHGASPQLEVADTATIADLRRELSRFIPDIIYSTIEIKYYGTNLPDSYPLSEIPQFGDKKKPSPLILVSTRPGAKENKWFLHPYTIPTRPSSSSPPRRTLVAAAAGAAAAPSAVKKTVTVAASVARQDKPFNPQLLEYPCDEILRYASLESILKFAEEKEWIVRPQDMKFPDLCRALKQIYEDEKNVKRAATKAKQSLATAVAVEGAGVLTRSRKTTVVAPAAPAAAAAAPLTSPGKKKGSPAKEQKMKTPEKEGEKKISPKRKTLRPSAAAAAAATAAASSRPSGIVAAAKREHDIASHRVPGEQLTIPFSVKKEFETITNESEIPYAVIDILNVPEADPRISDLAIKIDTVKKVVKERQRDYLYRGYVLRLTDLIDMYGLLSDVFTDYVQLFKNPPPPLALTVEMARSSPESASAALDVIAPIGLKRDAAKRIQFYQTISPAYTQAEREKTERDLEKSGISLAAIKRASAARLKIEEEKEKEEGKDQEEEDERATTQILLLYNTVVGAKERWEKRLHQVVEDDRDQLEKSRILFETRLKELSPGIEYKVTRGATEYEPIDVKDRSEKGMMDLLRRALHEITTAFRSSEKGGNWYRRASDLQTTIGMFVNKREEEVKRRQDEFEAKHQQWVHINPIRERLGLTSLEEPVLHVGRENTLEELLAVREDVYLLRTFLNYFSQGRIQMLNVEENKAEDVRFRPMENEPSEEDIQLETWFDTIGKDWERRLIRRIIPALSKAIELEDSLL